MGEVEVVLVASQPQSAGEVLLVVVVGLPRLAHYSQEEQLN